MSDLLLPKKPSLFLPESYVAKVNWEKEKRKRLRYRAAENLRKHATQKIQEAYPEHLFFVEVIPDTGDLFVDHLLLSKAGARYFCKFKDYQDGKGVVRLAGEILERVNMHRSELKYYEDYSDPRVEALAETEFRAK